MIYKNRWTYSSDCVSFMQDTFTLSLLWIFKMWNVLQTKINDCCNFFSYFLCWHEKKVQYDKRLLMTIKIKNTKEQNQSIAHCNGASEAPKRIQNPNRLLISIARVWLNRKKNPLSFGDCIWIFLHSLCVCVFVWHDCCLRLFCRLLILLCHKRL